jgi:hypothetical protein
MKLTFIHVSSVNKQQSSSTSGIAGSAISMDLVTAIEAETHVWNYLFVKDNRELTGQYLMKNCVHRTLNIASPGLPLSMT